MMDELSRWTVARVIKDKHPETIIKAITEGWCLQGMGYPKRSFFVDNVGEFQGNLLDTLVWFEV